MQETSNYSTLPGHLLVDGLTTEICTYLLYCFISQTIAVFGVFTNIINIMCFMKQGFSETINISLLGKNRKSKSDKKILILRYLHFSTNENKRLLIKSYLEMLHVYIYVM